MSDENGAATPTDTVVADTAAPGSEQATQEQTTQPETGAATENAETQEQTDETEFSSEEQGESRRLNRTQRLQRKAARLSTMLAEQAAEIERLKAAAPNQGPQPPKEEDFGGDYFAYQRALTKWDTEQVVNSALSKLAPEKPQSDPRAVQREDIIEDLKERIEAAKKDLPDFMESLAKLGQHVGDLSGPVLEEIGESEKGEYILYHLAKNPKQAAALNQMSARDVAREIARLEFKVSLPQPKKQTQAPAPITPLKGGAAPTKSAHDLAKSEDVSEFIKAERARKAARA